MAVHLNGNPRGRRQRGRWSQNAPMSDINVTPMVDVMLVLLIVFMVAAPLLTVGVPVDLPQSAARPMEDQTEPLTVTVKRDGQVYLQETKIEMNALVPKIAAITQSNPDARIFVRGDRNISYGDIMQVMGQLNAAGFRKVALVTETPKGS
jgi:biopolymer transport protein TolR